MEEKSVVLVLSRAIKWASQVVTVVSNLWLMQNVIDVGLIPRLEKIPWRRGMIMHSSILVWRTPWTEEPDRLRAVHRITKSQT